MSIGNTTEKSLGHGHGHGHGHDHVHGHDHGHEHDLCLHPTGESIVAKNG